MGRWWSAECTGASSLAKQRLQLASAAEKRPLPRPPLLSPHHQIIAKYLLMFFFHPSKRWSPACSRAPSWFCCVWRQCSASEPSEVKGGHTGRQERGPESRRGPPLAAHPCKPATHRREGRRPPPGAPLPALLRGSPEHAFPAGRVAERGCDPHVRPGGTWLLDVQGVGGRWRRRKTLPFPNLRLNFIFLNTLAALDASPSATRAGRRASSRTTLSRRVRARGAGLRCLQPPFAFTLRAGAPAFEVYF